MTNLNTPIVTKIKNSNCDGSCDSSDNSERSDFLKKIFQFFVLNIVTKHKLWQLKDSKVLLCLLWETMKFFLGWKVGCRIFLEFFCFKIFLILDDNDFLFFFIFYFVTTQKPNSKGNNVWLVSKVQQYSKQTNTLCFCPRSYSANLKQL